jgi:hypothetical protein
VERCLACEADFGAPGCARVLARRKDILEANGVFSPPDRRRRSASGTIRQLPDGDAIPLSLPALAWPMTDHGSDSATVSGLGGPIRTLKLCRTSRRVYRSCLLIC